MFDIDVTETTFASASFGDVLATVRREGIRWVGIKVHNPARTKGAEDEGMFVNLTPEFGRPVHLLFPHVVNGRLLRFTNTFFQVPKETGKWVPADWNPQAGALVARGNKKAVSVSLNGNGDTALFSLEDGDLLPDENSDLFVCEWKLVALSTMPNGSNFELASFPILSP